MKFTTRAHEWLADRFGFVQYPKIKPADRTTAALSGPSWRIPMHWTKRVTFALAGTVILVICGLLLFLLGLLAWAVITA